MIDLPTIKRIAEEGDGAEQVPVTRRMLAQIVAEISAGRDAHKRLGQVFGLRSGEQI